jgi:hypothetical protein
MSNSSSATTESLPAPLPRSLAEAKSELAKKAEQRAEAAEASLKQLKEG